MPEYVNSWQVTSVADHAFSLCPGLVAVTLPSSISSVGKWLFTASDDIAALEMNSSVMVDDKTLDGVDNPNMLLYVTSKSNNQTSLTNVVIGTKADAIVLQDAGESCNFYCPKLFTASKISYTHSYVMRSGIGECRGWETIVLPFDVRTITHQSNGLLTPFAAYTRNPGMKPFWLYELSSTGWRASAEISANTPYIICMPNNSAYDSEYNLGGQVTYSATNATVRRSASTDLIQPVYNNRTFIPTFQSKAKEGINAINARNLYVMEIGDGTHAEGSIFLHELRAVRPFEAYIVNADGSNADYGFFEDMTTALHELPAPTPAVAPNYRVATLAGQVVREMSGCSPQEAVNGLPQGVYIVNGQKVVVR